MANDSGGGGGAARADKTRVSGGHASQLMVTRQRSEVNITSGSNGGSWGAGGRRRYSHYYAQLDPEQADGEGALCVAESGGD